MTVGSATTDRSGKRDIAIAVSTAILGGAIGVYGVDIASDDDAISRRTAQEFIVTLYAEATSSETVEEAWRNRLSSDLQEIDSLSSYTTWWSNWSDVEIDGPVHSNPDVTNGFVARIAYVDTEGQVQSYREVMYQLECKNALAGHMPGVTCDVEDVRLIDTWQPGTQ